LAHIFPNDECFENPATLLSTHARGLRDKLPSICGMRFGILLFGSVVLGFRFCLSSVYS